MPTILVIDDDIVTCTLIKAMFRHLPVQVLTFHNAEDGLAAAKEHLPSVIVMDLILPLFLDGWQATQQIKSDPTLKHIPVIAITAADVGFGDEQRAYEAGCDGYVLKPFDPKNFRQYLSQFIELL